MSDQVGRLLAQRYRLEQPIGAGTSAEVYLAFDTELQRRVAAKVLHSRLAADPRFLRRFNEEAEAVASLNHPNILAIHDRGDDDGPFIITEYLAGGSLAEILAAGRTLTVEQVLVVGLETARGLTYAHEAGFAHRDIKPANLLFDDEGRLRISDFGLARALAEVAATELDGSLLGTALYASPEQARGESAGPASDIYSLAVVLTEAVTGSRPFESDTALASLMARINEPLSVPAELGPIREILTAAGQINPDDRPTAEEFGGALVGASRGLTRPGPLPLAATAILVGDADPTIRLGPPSEAPPRDEVPPDAIVIDAGDRPESDETLVGVGAGAAADDAEHVGSGVDGDPPPADVDEPETPGSLYDQDHDDPGHEPHRGLAIALAIFIVAAIAAVGAFIWYQNQTPTHTVPALIGKSESELDDLVGDLGWEVEVVQTRVDDSEPGEIVDQDPDAGASLEEGAVLSVTVSLGATLVELPTDVAGLTLQEAEALLVEMGFVLGDLTRTFDEDTPVDTVLGLGPDVDGVTELPKGSPVGLLVSEGPPPRELPDLVGVTRNEAELKLGELGLVAVVTEDSSTEVPEGVVISMSPEPGSQIEKGAEASIVVSTGQPWTLVPDVSGSSPSDAADELEEVGLVVAGTDGPPNQDVVATDPAAGLPIQLGSEITLITAEE
jgi:beta-lactam-binding protein with PASTA domain/tRNA A-37 threonylcarbamoyl transferase component Bud32